jgi:membrane protein DedA with SNARE-associated domain
VNIDHLVTQYGYLTVFALVTAECLGVPLPGETALITASIFAGHYHRLSPWIIWAVGSVSAAGGGIIGYLIGWFGGYRLVRRYGHKIRLNEAKLKVGRYAFDRHGIKVVFFGRFVTVLRTYAAFLAGVNKMERVRFVLADIAGALIWAAIYTFVPYAVGSALDHVTGTVNIVLIGVAIVVVVAVVIYLRRKARQLEEVAEAAYPGPLDG